MRRLLTALGGALLVAACGAQTGAPPAQVVDPHDLLSVTTSLIDGGSESLLFIAATGGDELRVVDLGPHLVTQDFVRAPNPLEPLSIPVVEQPVGLATDTTYADGQPVYGPYLYVRGAGSQQISVVDSHMDGITGLAEVQRIVAPGVVTAIAARGPDNGNPLSRLYAGTYDGTRGSLWEYDLPGPLRADNGTLPDLAVNPRFLVATNPGESIAALLPLPDTQEVVIATRAVASGGGETVAYDPGAHTTRPLQFPAPVRLLKTNPALTTVTGGSLKEGTYVYGLLDESSCGGQLGCRGLMAVDNNTGQVALDGTGRPMLPIDIGGGPIQGFDLIPGAIFTNVPDSGQGGCPGASAACVYPLLGAGTTAGSSDNSGVNGGSLFFFDAVNLQVFGYLPPLQDGGLAAPVTLTGTADGGILDAGTSGPTNIAVQPGGARSETVLVTYQGVIPGLQGIQGGSTDGGFFPADGVAAHIDPLAPPVATVQPMDAVLLGGIADAGLDGGACDQVLRVGAVQLPPAVPGVVLDPSTPIPPECAGFTEFTVRAGGAEPFVVVGSLSGFLGRVGPNQAFTGGAYFYHAPGFNPAVPPLSFTMGPLDPNVVQDSAYQMVLDVPFLPFHFYPDPSVFLSVSGTPAGLVPSSVAWWYDPVNQWFYEYVSYPAHNGVLRFQPPQMAPYPLITSGLDFFFFGSG